MSIEPKILIVDSHPLALIGAAALLKQVYAAADVITAQTAQEGLTLADNFELNLVMLDLLLSNSIGEVCSTEIGLQFLMSLMRSDHTLNIVVQSANPERLIRLKTIIRDHKGGFATLSKHEPAERMLQRVEMAMLGIQITPRELRSGLEIKSDWLRLLDLAFVDGLTDSAIAKQMNITEKTVSQYWKKIQDALEVQPERSKNIRIQTEIRAREVGLLD